MGFFDKRKTYNITRHILVFQCSCCLKMCVLVESNSAMTRLITHVLVFSRCPDASIQPVVGCLRGGSGPGGVLIFLLIAQPGVSSLR